MEKNPLKNLPDILESTPKLLFSECLHAFQAHTLEPKLFAIINKLFYHNILHESLLLLFSALFLYCKITALFSNFLFAVQLLPSAQSLPWELFKLCVDTIMPFDNGVELSTKCCYEQMDHERERK